MSNLQDGRPPGTGLYFQQFVQSYTANQAADAEGNKLAASGKLSTLLSLSQLIYISPLKVAGGNFGWTVLVPLVKITAYDPAGLPVGANPNSLGDIVTGPFVQWFSRKIAGIPLDHRFELDVTLPTGGWENKYAINPGAHGYSISPHYTLTLSPTKHFSISMRQYLNYNFEQIGTDVKAGAFYNANYSLEYELLTRFRVEFAGYFLRQFAQDSKGGDSQYYQNSYGLPDTRERVFALGPGLGYVTSTGLFLEVKNMWETAVRNRTQGYRTTLVLAYKLK
ncbi:transporter [Pedobacter sp. L105]|uniref:SphA family protein n=1 Tax=Pedobacter sp. L105 TaxID=1641871 RepID=UPI00131DAE82|nr:transporter [Pedobacter sp. L105]